MSHRQHWERADVAYYAGRHRESADEYLEAYRSVPSQTNDHRYFFLRGCTSILRDDHFEATDEDFNNVRAIFENKRELRLFRLETAGFTLALEVNESLHRRVGERLQEKSRPTER